MGNYLSPETLKSQQSSPTHGSTELSRFVIACCDEELNCNEVSFVAALPKLFQQHGRALFLMLGKGSELLSSDEMEKLLRQRIRSGFTLDDILDIMSIDHVLSICMNHTLTIPLEPGSSPAHVFPWLSRHFSQAFFASILNERDNAQLYVESEILHGWHLSLICMFSDTNLLEAAVSPTRLFSSRSHGCSLSTLAGHILGYESSMVIVFKDRKGAVFGAFSPRGLAEGKEFSRSDTGTFLFQIFPEIRIRRWSGREASRNFNYFNVASPHYIKGIGFGGQQSYFRLFVDEDLKRVTSLDSDATFEAGQLLCDNEQVELSGLEIWGLGGEQALADYHRKRADLREIREERKKVEKRAFVESEFDKETFFSKTFQKAEQL